MKMCYQTNDWMTVQEFRRSCHARPAADNRMDEVLFSFIGTKYFSRKAVKLFMKKMLPLPSKKKNLDPNCDDYLTKILVDFS